MKISQYNKVLPLIPLLFSSYAFGLTSYGNMTLTLIGVVDLAKNPDVSTPQYVSGILSGSTSFSHSPIYGDYFGGPSSIQWSNTNAFVGITGDKQFCYLGQDIFKAIPGTNAYGLPLTDSAGRSDTLYVIPSLRYKADAGYNLTPSVYTGEFFSQNQQGLVSYEAPGRCLRPDGRISTKGTKVITISNNDRYPIYVTQNLQPGPLYYRGAPLYVVSQGREDSANASVRVNINANLKVIRICQVSNVTNNNINVIMPRENEVITESSINYSCTGVGRSLYISAIATEGTPNASDPTKLMLNQLSGNNSGTNVPWVIGKPFTNGMSPNLSCSMAGVQDLLKFNNEDLNLSKMATDKIETLGIKWAICSNDTVQPGTYRGRALVTIYTKV